MMNKSGIGRLFLVAIALVFFTLAPRADCADTKPPPTIQDKDILSYIQEVINWRRAIVDSDLPPDNARVALLKDSLRQDSQKALRSAFDFAHAEATLLEEGKTAGEDNAKNNSRHNTLVKRIEETTQRIDDLQAQLDATTPTDVAQREKLAGELKVEKAHLELLNNFMTIFSINENDDTGLIGAINKLSYSILGDLNEPPPGGAPKQDNNKENTMLPTGNDNVIGVISDVLALTRKKQAIDALIKQTDDLSASTRNLIAVMRGLLQEAIQEGNALADAPVATDAKSLAQHRRDLDAWSRKYKQLSAAVIPLGQISSLLDTSTSSLKEWNDILNQEWNKLFRHFIWRLSILCVSLLIPFVFSSLAHRGIIRYVNDNSRIRQLNVVRQVAFVTLLTLVIFLNFFTEFGSLATYAGFLTAGLAVALQTVLVSLTAHFFFFGRFGARAGDRVTISGVTGDVVQVGMLRLYLMELIGEEGALRPSGKIVAFPNSVLFNPTAFSKQIVGTNYIWKDLAFQLDPNSDFTAATAIVMTAVNSVYQEYKNLIERQHITLERSTNLLVDVPAPRNEISLKEPGLICTVHYPVIIDRAAKIYQEILLKLMKAFENNKDFKLILTNPLKIVNAKDAFRIE